MSECFGPFDPNTNYAKQFIEKYSKTLELPMTKLINAFFHPTLRDHIITLNEVKFPDIDWSKVKGLIPDKNRNEFEVKIKNQYMSAAEKYEAKRKVKQTRNLNIHNKKKTEKLPSSDDTYSLNWSENFSESSYEGGEEEHLDRKKTLNRKQIRLRSSKSLKPNVTPKDIMKIVGDYPKVSTQKSRLKEINQKINSQRNFNKAVDMFMQDRNEFLSYKGFDFALQTGPNSETFKFSSRPEENSKIGDQISERLITYSPIPKYENMSYV